ncbi:MAG: YceI family protein [Verrucomicrobia bacterium]|nr:YceI family protein [Verrucomicrobiota bacterium]
MKPSKLLLVALLGASGLFNARGADAYQIDPVHSSVLFKVRHLNVADFYGRFNEVSGTITLDNADPGNDVIDVEIKTDSLDTHNDKRNQHLKSPDFFNAKQFPTITFKSTKVEKAGDDTYKVTGNLTLHGVTKPLTAEFKKTGEGKGMQNEYRAGGTTEFTIKRSDFGMNFMPNVAGDDVGLILSLEGIRK